MVERRPVPKLIETRLLRASRRRCCLCVFLNHNEEVRKGQVGHLNHDPSDNRFDNVVWLCLEHHDEYDSKASQSKGLTTEEVRRYREDLYARYPPEAKSLGQVSARLTETPELPPLSPTSEYEALRTRFPAYLGTVRK